MTEGEKIYPKIPIEKIYPIMNISQHFNFNIFFTFLISTWMMHFRRLFLYNENDYNNYQLNKSSTLSTLHIL